MNLKAIMSGARTIIPMIPSIKAAIFADGKFKPKRAVILLAFLITIGGMIHLIGVDETKEAVEMVDEISDTVGYGE